MRLIEHLSHINDNLSANEGFIIFVNIKLMTCFIDNFTSKMKSQSIAYLYNGSAKNTNALNAGYTDMRP